MELKTITLPQNTLAASLARECIAMQCLGSISGPPGTGKTVALRAIESAARPGKCLYVRAYRAEGPTRAVRDVLEALGVRGTLLSNNISLQFLIRAALKEMKSRDLELLVIDEADAWSAEALKGFVSLYDAGHQFGQPFAAILAGNADMVKWLAGFAAALSRTLRCEEFQNLDGPLVLGVLREWDPYFEGLTQTIKEKPTRKLLDAILKSTGGNLRRLSFFARLHQLHFPGQSVTEETLAQVTCLLTIEK